jgi:hypothetical protein
MRNLSKDEWALTALSILFWLMLAWTLFAISERDNEETSQPMVGAPYDWYAVDEEAKVKQPKCKHHHRVDRGWCPEKVVIFRWTA